MLDKLAGFKTQIRILEKQLKEMDHSKLDSSKVKEVTEAIKNLKDLVKEKEDKRDARRKAKEEVSKPAEVEAAVVPTEVVKESSPIPTEEVVKEAEVNKFAIDSRVEPIRGMSGSVGVVIREAGVNGDPLVYVKWTEGNLKTAHGEYGAYYPTDLKLKAEEIKAEVNPDLVPRENLQKLEADLKSNYERMLADLHEEIKMAQDKGELTWIGRLEEKLAEIQKAYDEKYGNEKHAEDENGSGGTNKLKVYDLNPPYDKDPQEKSTGYGGDRPMGAMVAPNGEENSLPLEGSLKQALDKMDPNPLNMADKYYCNHCGYSGKDFHFINVDKDPSKHSGLACPKCHKEVALNNPKHSSLKTADNDATERAFERAVDRLDKKLMKEEIHQEEYDAEYAKLKKEMFPKEASIKLADLDLNSVEKRWALYVDGKLAIRTLTRSKADRVAKERFPTQLAAGKVEIKREDSVPATASLDKQAINVTVEEKLFVVNPMGKTAENEYNYDVSLADGSKLFKITSADEMGQEHLAYVIEKELLKKEASQDDKCYGCAKTPTTHSFQGGSNDDRTGKWCDSCFKKQTEKQEKKEKKSSLAKLTSNLAFLKKGSLVSIIAVDNSKKQIKFASLDNSLRGWAPMQKFAAMNVPEAKLIDHEGHKDEILGESGNELLVTCPSGSNNVIFREITAPPATPESLNDMESAKECSDCHGNFVGAEGDKCPTCGRFAIASSNKKADEETLEDQPDNENDIFIQSEGSLGSETVAYQGGKPLVKLQNDDWDKFYSRIFSWMTQNNWYPTVWQVSDHGNIVPDSDWQKFLSALGHKDKLASLKIKAHIRHEDGKWIVYNHDYKKKLGTYDTKEEATKRLRQIEYFKHEGSLKPLSKKEARKETKCVKCDKQLPVEDMIENVHGAGYLCKEHAKDWNKDASLKKADVTDSSRGRNWKVTYYDKNDKVISSHTIKDRTEAEASKEAQGDMPSGCEDWSMMPMREKKADQEISLEQQVQGFKDRMSAVTERLSNPPVKQASELDETSKGEDAITTSELIESLERGIDLLEGKTSDQLSPEEHHNLEEMENLLWKVEDSLGLSHPLPEHEMEEPEHAEETKLREPEFKEEAIATESKLEVKADDVNTPPSTLPPAGFRYAWDPKSMTWILVQITGAPGGGQ